MRLGMKRKHSRLVVIPVSLCLFFGAAHCLLKRAEPVFYAECSNYSNTAFTDLVNKCVLEELPETDSELFFKHVTDKNGAVTAVEAQTGAINKIKARLLINIQNTLNADYPANVKIPLGSLTNYSLLTYYGPSVKIKVYPISVVDCELEEAFESAGINNIRHKLYLKFSVDMRYKGYTMDERERIETVVPIAESVIMGTVPERYGGLFGSIPKSGE